jgi:hypothetical protein
MAGNQTEIDTHGCQTYRPPATPALKTELKTMHDYTIIRNGKYLLALIPGTTAVVARAKTPEQLNTKLAKLEGKQRPS